MDCPDICNILETCKGYSLVLPAVSVSNTGQLAVDLLIQSTGVEKVGNIWHEAFISLIGAHPYKEGSTELCTEFEVYALKQHKLLFLQFRSPLWESKEENFLNTLVEWFEQLKVEKVIILSSLYDYERSDSQIRDPTVRCCVCPRTQPLYESTLRHLNCRYLEGKKEEPAIISKATFLPGAGFTQSLHLKCIDKGLPCVSFFKFCSDGDNTPEALELAKIVDGWLNIVPTGSGKAKTFTEPPSWKCMFGGPSPPELFP